MDRQEAPRDLKFVALFFIAGFLVLLFMNGGSVGHSFTLLLLSVPISIVGAAIYKMATRRDFTWPKTWPEWIFLYFIGLIIGGVLLVPFRLLFNW